MFTVQITYFQTAIQAPSHVNPNRLPFHIRRCRSVRELSVIEIKHFSKLLIRLWFLKRKCLPEKKMALRVQFENNDDIGVFTKLTNSYCLVAIGGAETFYR